MTPEWVVSQVGIQLRSEAEPRTIINMFGAIPALHRIGVVACVGSPLVTLQLGAPAIANGGVTALQQMIGHERMDSPDRWA